MRKRKEKPSGLDWLCRELLVAPYCYALCLDEKSFDAEQERLGVPPRRRQPFLKTTHAGATTTYFEETEGHGKCCIVTMPPRKDKELEQIYALLVHEAVHIWQACKDVIGEHTPGHEEEAYAIQSIAQALMFSYKEQTAKKRRKSK